MGQADRILAARDRMHAVMAPNQVIGRTLTTGCTAVEITQRCNLDCTLCYLSENAESTADVPLPEILRRLREIRHTFGPGTNVQITGGDPTLRKHDELVEIVRTARALELFPALFTNGIAASRKLLERLAEAGLCDVAFHVDTTQNRPGATDERSLNALRLEYLRRASGLGLMVIFNTTVHRGNLHDVDGLVRFFIDNADGVGFASFQLQAETGRGVWGARDEAVTLDGVRARVARAAGVALPWDVVRVGHPRCHSYVPTLVVNGRVFPIIDDEALFSAFLADFDDAHADRRLGRAAVARAYAAGFARRPRWLPRAAAYAVRGLHRMGRDLLAARGRVHKLSFFVQNFMDAGALDEDRIEACSFKVMTADGPVSMCAHNADRDTYVLKPLLYRGADGRLARYEPLVEKRSGATARGTG